MQAFKVKLNEGHTAEPDQITKDGYLADDDGQPFIYNQAAAKYNANLFGGTPEKFGKSYTTSKVTMIQFDQNFLDQKIVELAREKQCYDGGKSGMFICYGRVFEDILEEGGIPLELVKELQALSVFCVEIDYVHFL